MSKVKYYYDSESLSYRKIERKKGRRFGVFALSFLGMILSGFLLLLIYINLPYIETPKEKALSRELNNMQLQFNLLNKKMDQAVTVLGEVRIVTTISIVFILSQIQYQMNSAELDLEG